MDKLITTIGLNKINSATPLDQLNITHIAIGDGNGSFPTLSVSDTALTNELDRKLCSAPFRDDSDPTKLKFEIQIPPDEGGYVIREIGLFDNDGDLISVALTRGVNDSGIPKPDNSLEQGSYITIVFVLELNNASDVDVIYQDSGFIDHQGLLNKDANNAHPATSILSSDGRNVEQRLNDLPSEVSAVVTAEADRAEVAADAAQLSAGVYADTTAGLTATSVGDYFSVPSVEDDEYLILYLHDTGSVATEIKRYPSVNKVDGIEGDIRELGYFAELEANYVEVTTDEDGNVMEAITPDGMRLVNGLRVGNVEVGLDEKSGILELINTSGVSIDSTVYIDKAIDLIGQFSGYSFILCDEDGNISQGVAHNGSTLTSIGTSVGWDLKYSSATSLPDNSRQPNPSGGFTCTGITRINTGFWAVSNHGIASEGGSVQEPSIVFLHLDFTKIRKEINFDNWSNPVTGSIQGITFNPNDNTIWFIDKTNGLVRQTDYDATDYDNDIDPGYTVNGLAYNTAENGLWIPREGTTVCNLYSVDTKTIIRSINVRTNLDQMFHDPVTDLIYYTYGSNGTNGNIEVIDTNGNVLHNFTGIRFAQSIEGIYVDDNKLYITNDGGYHTSAKPPLSMVLEYDLTLGDY